MLFYHYLIKLQEILDIIWLPSAFTDEQTKAQQSEVFAQNPIVNQWGLNGDLLNPNLVFCSLHYVASFGYIVLWTHIKICIIFNCVYILFCLLGYELDSGIAILFICVQLLVLSTVNCTLWMFSKYLHPIWRGGRKGWLNLYVWFLYSNLKALQHLALWHLKLLRPQSIFPY